MDSNDNSELHSSESIFETIKILLHSRFSPELVKVSLEYCFDQDFEVSISDCRICIEWGLDLEGIATENAVLGFLEGLLPVNTYPVYKNNIIMAGITCFIEPSVKRREKAKEMVLSEFKNTKIPEHLSFDNYKFRFNDTDRICYEAEARYLWLLDNGDFRGDMR